MEFFPFYTYNFCNDSKVLGQVTDHGLIVFKLTGWTVLKKLFCTTGSLATLILIFSPRLHFSGVPLNTLICLPGDLKPFCVGPGLGSLSPSISSCFNLRKLRLSPESHWVYVNNINCYQSKKNAKASCIVLPNTTMTKEKITKWCRHSQTWWELHFRCLKMSQSVVESSKGYYSHCV